MSASPPAAAATGAAATAHAAGMLAGKRLQRSAELHDRRFLGCGLPPTAEMHIGGVVDIDKTTAAIFETGEVSILITSETTKRELSTIFSTVLPL